jgi:hypothetical protein
MVGVKEGMVRKRSAIKLMFCIGFASKCIVEMKFLAIFWRQGIEWT